MVSSQSKPYTIAVNPETKRVGCILIQRLLGASATAEQIMDFDWEVHDIEGMRVFTADDNDLAKLRKVCALA